MGAGSFPTALNSTALYTDNLIGRYLTQYFNGLIDEVSIFDYSLDATEISTLYNSGVPTDLSNTIGLTPPVHWWRMGDGATWNGTNWSVPDVGATGGMTGTSVNMELVDRFTDVP
jgi:hypothetical protein